MGGIKRRNARDFKAVKCLKKSGRGSKLVIESRERLSSTTEVWSLMRIKEESSLR